MPTCVQAVLPSLALNSDMLPLLRYILTPQEVAQLTSGRISPREHGALLAKVQAAMVRPPEKIVSEASADLKLMADPNYRLEDVLVGGGEVSHAGVLDSMKAELCTLLNLASADGCNWFPSAACAKCVSSCSTYFVPLCRMMPSLRSSRAKRLHSLRAVRCLRLRRPTQWWGSKS